MSNGDIDSPVATLIKQKGCLIIDGAMATELEARGCDLTDSLWSAKVLIEEPELIYQVHLDYFRAGADCAITASYQASLPGFTRRGLSEAKSRELMSKSVQLAQKAREDYLRQSGTDKMLLIAGSVGPYGAYLADGSEYRGDYTLSDTEMKAFHRPRLEALIEAGVDLLAFETQPSAHEVDVLLTLLQEYPTLTAWFSFTLRDESHLSDGTSLEEVISGLNQSSQVAALGVNCIALENVTDALVSLQGLTEKPLLVYPNSGEHYDAITKTWHVCGETQTIATHVEEWYSAGARLIGGCCRTTPRDIESIAHKIAVLR